jgi:gamma-glutamyltranspeptidase / glutathione hydrolase
MRNFQLPGRSTVHAINGAAATSSPSATLAAIEVLRQGGNAADAAVTAAAVLNVTEPHMTGIGGDCFALVGEADGSIHGLNGSGRAPAAANEDWLKACRLSQIERDSVHAITVPGAVDGWASLLQRFGTIGLKEAVEPAVRLAEEGTPVTPRVALDWKEKAETLRQDEGARQHFLLQGRAPQAGEIMRYPALAKSLRIIAKEGRDGFYAGAIADDIVGYVQAQGSLLTKEDFARTKSDWIAPISSEFANHEIIELPPNGHGVTTLIALNVLRQFDLQAHAPDSAERIHLEIEAMRLAWIYRNRHVADRDFVDVAIDHLLSEATALELAGLISLERAISDPSNLVPKPQSDTVYLSVVDKNRLAVSFINSLYLPFGSGRVTSKTGIVLQNRGACFVTKPNHPNCIGPGKRPLHTLMPGMIRRDGRVSHSFGVMGGAYQPMGHISVAVNHLLYGMDVQEALDFPRHFHDEGLLNLEDGAGSGLAKRLEEKGHHVVRAEQPLGGGQMVKIDGETGTLVAGSDPRKDGIALGY